MLSNLLFFNLVNKPNRFYQQKANKQSRKIYGRVDQMARVAFMNLRSSYLVGLIKTGIYQ